jgi:hypothetical protein
MLGATEPAYLRSLAKGTEDLPVPICLAWIDRDITYIFDAAGSSQIDNDREFAAVKSAFAAWRALSDTCSDFRFQEGPRQAQAPAGKNTETGNVIVFREVSCRGVAPQDNACWLDGSCSNVFHCWDESDLTIAITTTTHSKLTGKIYDADVEFNGAPHLDGPGFVLTTVDSPACKFGSEASTCVALDVQNTMTHEIGHMLGLDHVEIAGSTMEPTAPVGEITKRVIDRGTADGFCLIYPRGQPPQPCDVRAQQSQTINVYTTGTMGCGCSNAGSWPLAMLAAGVIGLARAARASALRRRRRRAVASSC